MEPPDTEEKRLIFDSSFVSFSRHSTPTWKTIARYPPPERHSATPSSSWVSASAGVGVDRAQKVGLFDVSHQRPTPSDQTPGQLPAMGFG